MCNPLIISKLGSAISELLKMFNPLGPLQDQQLGGILMMTVQEIVYAVITAKIFRDWYRKDQEEVKEIKRVQLKSYKEFSR